MFETVEHSSGIASAPGDLPMPAVRQRDALRASQFRHDNQRDPATPQSDQPAVIRATSGAAMEITRAEIWFTSNGSRPDETAMRLPMTLATVDWTAATSYLNVWEATLPAQPSGTIVRYKIAGYCGDERVFAHDGSGFWFMHGAAGITTFAYRVQDAPDRLPTWMQDAITYHIFLDRFRTNDGGFSADNPPTEKHGGTLRGVIDALPYLSELGVNCLWISPVGPSPSYHRYDQTDYFAVDPVLGTLDDLRELVTLAHGRGMRLILDFVPSHCSWKLPQFVAAQADLGADSADWFIFDEWPDSYRNFLGVVPFLVSFNSESDGLHQFLIESARFWLCEVGFDGLRLDHAIGHGSDFWVAFSSALQEAKPDVALFGEVTDTPDNLRRFDGQLQGILDFPLAQILRMGFGRGEWDAATTAGALAAYTRFMQGSVGRVTFLDNHDMNRFLFVAGDDKRRLRLAALALFTLPLPPVLYYGTEIGLSQPQDKDAGGFGGDHVLRPDMVWDEAAWDTDLLAYFKQLIALRRENAVLRRGTWELDFVDGDVFGYRVISSEITLRVILNLGETAYPLASDQPPLFSTGTWQNRIEGLGGVVLELTESI